MTLLYIELSSDTSPKQSTAANCPANTGIVLQNSFDYNLSHQVFQNRVTCDRDSG